MKTRVETQMTVQGRLLSHIWKRKKALCAAKINVAVKHSKLHI